MTDQDRREPASTPSPATVTGEPSPAASETVAPSADTADAAGAPGSTASFTPAPAPQDSPAPAPQDSPAVDPQDPPASSERAPRPDDEPPTTSQPPPETASAGDLPSSPAELPVDHDDREHVVDLLQKAVSRGLIGTLEFDRRSGLATTARTRRDLNGLVVDLPLEHPDQARTRTAAESRRRTAAPPADEARTAYAAGDTSGTVALHARLSSLKRSGPWAVPRRLEIDGWLGSAELDLTEAVIDHEVVEIDLDMTLGSVELRLPGSASVSLDGVSAMAGSVEDKRRGASPAGRPHVVVTGHVTFGSVEVKGPKWWKS